MRAQFYRGWLDLIVKAILKRGYYRLRSEDGSYRNDFRKGPLHIILRQGANAVYLHIHRDARYHIGRTRHKGEDLKKEVKEIRKTYNELLRKKAATGR